MGMSFIGSYSGIDQNTIDKLMQAERMPLKQLENKKVDITGKRDAWKDINTRLNSLAEKLNVLKKASTFNSKTAKSSDDKYVSMSVGSSAAEGKYNINVKELASNSSIIGGHVQEKVKVNGIDSTIDANTKLGGTDSEGKLIKDGLIGKFKIANGDETSVTAIIEIEGKDSLRDIVGKINDNSKETGISATIVDNRIVLNDEKTGARGIALEGIDGFDLDKIGLDIGIKDEDGNVLEGKASLNEGEQAIFTLNGIEIRRDSNTIKDAIDGVVITLNQKHIGEAQSDTVTVSSDTEKAAKAMQDFVDQYNSTMQFIQEKTVAGDPEIPGSKGVLSGEGSLIRLQQSLRKSVSNALRIERKDKQPDEKDISLGINTQDKSGVLVFDKEEFLSALKNDGAEVLNFLNTEKTGFVDDTNKFIDQFISKKDGFIKSQNESFDRSLKDLARRIEQFEERMVKKEAYYVKTFTALDVAMMKAEDQMGWLIGQVDAMNAGKR